MLLIPLMAISTIWFLSLVATMCDVAEEKRLADLAERLPELSAAEFDLLLIGLTLPDGVLPPSPAAINCTDCATSGGAADLAQKL